jgi:hypothetical protein
MTWSKAFEREFNKAARGLCVGELVTLKDMGNDRACGFRLVFSDGSVTSSLGVISKLRSPKEAAEIMYAAVLKKFGARGTTNTSLTRPVAEVVGEFNPSERS